MAKEILTPYNEEEEATPAYHPNKRQRAVRRKVWNRYRDMADNQWRKDAEQDWDMADKQFRQWMPTRDPDDWRADISLPDGFAAIQAQMQETIDRQSRPELKRVEDSDVAKAAFANAIMTYNMDRTGFDFEYFKAKYAAAIRGTAFLFNYYRVDKREVYDPVSVNEDGTLKYKQKTITDFDDDFTEFVENEYIFTDETASHISYARDMIRREVLHEDEFERIYSQKPDFIDVDKVQCGDDTGDRSFFKLAHDMHGEDVEVLHYYNRATDEYLVLANNVTIHDGHIPYKHKELPIAVVYHYMIPGFFWGMGIPKVIWQLSEERRSLRNQNLDRQKLQLNKTFVVKDTAALDEEELYSRPHGMIEVNTAGASVSDTIVPLEYGDVPASYFRTEEVLLEDIRRAHGIDDRIQGVNVGGTATEAAILKESSQKRINLLARLVEMDTMIRLGRLKWSDIQFFYPAPKVERITEKNEEREKKVYKKITVKGKQFEVVKDDQGQSSLRFNEVNGDSSFTLDAKMARFMEGDFDVVIDSEAHSVLSKPIQQAKVTEMFTLLLSNPNIASVLDPKKAVFRYLEINEENPKDWMKGDGRSVQEMRALAEGENTVMAQGIPLPGTEGADEEHTLVHINFTQTSDFEKLPMVVQQIIKNHILEEHDNNPATGSAADLLAGAQGGSAGVAGAPMPNGAPGAGMNSLQSVDMGAQSPVANEPTGP
jgi:hypothetical protein